MKFFSALFDVWVWKMAWRDARPNVSRLFLFVASLAVGVAATVAISSFSRSMQREFDDNARALLGADLAVRSNQPFDSSALALFDSLRAPYIRGAETLSMAFFANRHTSQLVRVTALDPAYPLYGEFSTEPADARGVLHRAGGALVDQALAERYALALGDSIKIGERYFQIVGRVVRLSAAEGMASMYASSVYIAVQDLASTGLLQYGSRASYRFFFTVDDAARLRDIVEEIKPALIARGYTYSTAADESSRMGKDFTHVRSFFALLAFLSLILGCIGVSSSVYTYARQKRDMAAVLRCVGCSGAQAFAIFFVQVVVAGVGSSALGAAIGAGIHQAAFPLMQAYAPALLTRADIVWSAVWEGFALGVTSSVIFAALPLWPLRLVSPLSALRVESEPDNLLRPSGLVVLSALIFLPLAAWRQTRDMAYAFSFSAGILAVCGFLALTAYALMRAARRYIPTRAGFLLRHALSNLFRPHNQTQALTIALGLGAFIFIILHGVQHSLLRQSEFIDAENSANVVLFDIQPHQREGALAVLHQHGAQPERLVPIVTCRLQRVNGRAVEDMLQDSAHQTPEWALTREYRVTYRDTLQVSEELVEGQAQRRTARGVGITLSDNIIESLGVAVGDSLVFDVQGLPMPVFVSGVRKVDWPRMPPNFIVVFPSQTLEDAPQTWVATVAVHSTKTLNALQEDMLMQFPNVSVIDLRMALETFNTVLNKITLAIRFLGLFTLATGLLALAASLSNSRYVRLTENVLLRAIGARSGQLRRVALIEYAYLGFFSVLSGALLALPAGQLLTRLAFDIDFSFDGLTVVLTGLLMMLATVLVGGLNLNAAIGAPPLRVLRKEG